MGDAGPMRIVEDATCLGCGCLCDDIRVEVADGRVIAADPACRIGHAWFTAPHPGEGLPAATIDGQPASFEDAIVRAAEFLGNARSPLIWGLTDTTIEATREALAIADAIGATVDLDGSGSGDHRLTALQRVGQVSATLGEVRDRADVIVFWGVDPVATHPRLWGRCVDPAGEFVPSGRAGRSVIVVDSASTATSERADLFIRVESDRRGNLLRAIRGLIRGKALDPGRVERATGLPFAAIRDPADRLLAARYGAYFGGGEVGDAGEAEGALTLVRDLNDGRRFVLLELRGPGNAVGAGAVATWQAGAPSSIDFASGFPRFLPGEASMSGRRDAIDALLVVADAPPPFARQGVPTVSIGPGATALDRASSVAFDVARAGIEAGGTVARFDGVMLPLRPSLDPGGLPSDYVVLKSIADRLRG